MSQSFSCYLLSNNFISNRVETTCKYKNYAPDDKISLSWWRNRICKTCILILNSVALKLLSNSEKGKTSVDYQCGLRGFVCEMGFI